MAAGRKLQDRIITAISGIGPSRLWKNRDEFTIVLDTALESAGKVPSNVWGAVMSALGGATRQRMFAQTERAMQSQTQSFEITRTLR